MSGFYQTGSLEGGRLEVSISNTSRNETNTSIETWKKKNILKLCQMILFSVRCRFFLASFLEIRVNLPNRSPECQ